RQRRPSGSAALPRGRAIADRSRAARVEAERSIGGAGVQPAHLLSYTSSGRTIVMSTSIASMPRAALATLLLAAVWPASLVHAQQRAAQPVDAQSSQGLDVYLSED